MIKEEFPGGPVVRIVCFHLLGELVQSPVGELRSRMPQGQKKKTKKRMIKANSLPIFCFLGDQIIRSDNM